MADKALASAWAKVLGGDRKQFDMFFDHLLDGFAYHKIVVDKKGKPVDYVFLERIYPTEKIIPLFKLISTLDHNTITNKDELIKSLEDFRTMVYQDQEKLSEERVKVITDDINRIQKSLHSIEGNMGYDTTLPDLDSDKEEQK